MKFFNTFRGKLILILAVLLIATLGFQYYLNLVTQQENDDLRELQEQAIVAGFGVGFSSLTSMERVQELIDLPGQTFLDEKAKERLMDIIVIDSDWQIVDSLNPDYLPTTGDSGSLNYKLLSELTDLPPLMEGPRLGTDLEQFPNATAAADKEADDEAHAIPIDTSKGRWYVMVLLRNDKSAARWRAAQPLVFMLIVLLISSLITIGLVWHFTRPIADLSRAARAVAAGNLRVRVRDALRNDEIGRFAQNFNEMTAELEKKRELETQLQQAEKSAVVGRLGSAIAHEIRNPLNYINLTLDHLRSKFAPEDPDSRETFNKLTSQLKNEVARIDQQISDFLNYSRPAKAELVPTDIRKVIERSLRIVEPQASENNVTISVVEHENASEVLGDAEYIRSVFNNLFINAVHAMEIDGGHLNIKISPSNDVEYVEIEVTDTGNGIPEENLSKIFEPYFSTKETGTGLGLAIVHKIVESHNGTIEVESTGEGTKFTVKLPKAEGS